MEKLSKTVQQLVFTVILFSVIVSAACHADPETIHADIALIEDADYIIFGLKVGGEISCGHYQLLVHEFNKDGDLSCENEDVYSSLNNFNESMQNERFLVLWDVLGNLEKGTSVNIENVSQSGFEYGQKYLIFVNSQDGGLQMKRCSFFNRSFYKKMLVNMEDMTPQDVKGFVIENSSACEYQ